jgi:hypothetical protein
MLSQNPITAPAGGESGMCNPWVRPDAPACLVTRPVCGALGLVWFMVWSCEWDGAQHVGCCVYVQQACCSTSARIDLSHVGCWGCCSGVATRSLRVCVCRTARPKDSPAALPNGRSVVRGSEHVVRACCCLSLVPPSKTPAQRYVWRQPPSAWLHCYLMGSALLHAGRGVCVGLSWRRGTSFDCLRA